MAAGYFRTQLVICAFAEHEGTQLDSDVRQVPRLHNFCLVNVHAHTVYEVLFELWVIVEYTAKKSSNLRSNGRMAFAHICPR